MRDSYGINHSLLPQSHTLSDATDFSEILNQHRASTLCQGKNNIQRTMMDAVVKVLLDKLLAFLMSEGKQLLELDSQFDQMKDELRYIQSSLKQVDRMRRKDGMEVLKMVTEDLRKLVYDVEDVIADCQILLMKQHEGCLSNFMSNCSPQLLNFRFKITKRLKVLNQRIERVKDKMRSYLLTVPTTSTSGEEGSKIQPLRYPILMKETDMVGLEDDSKKVEKWILEEAESSTVIGIVGMGGIGKTTLAHKICDSDKIKHSFQRIIFVTVSQNCGLEDLLKRMLNKMNVEEEFLRRKDVDELLGKLQSELHDEKYLVVLDDIWENELSWWHSLNSAFPKKGGCCVIVTTRNEEVARSLGAVEKHVHRPQILSDDDSWSLFAKVAFARNGGKCPHSDLEGFGREIVARCGGLPLAIRVVGGMMAGKGDSVHEWRRISKHQKEALAEKKTDEPVMLSLALSYEELPAYLKPCLLCFALFPEDYSVYIDDIVYLWIGEGFVSESNGRTTLEIGKERAVELINRCLLISDRMDLFEKEFLYLRIHDLVRDMALKITRDENFMGSVERDRPEFIGQYRRLSMIRDEEIESVRSREEKKSTIDSKLRTLLLELTRGGSHILMKNLRLHNFKRLRVLNVSFPWHREDEGVIVKDCLGGITSLLHLVYIKVVNCKVKNLPDSIGDLRNLQILKLIFFKNLKMIPSTITKLDKLIVLEILSCRSLIGMPKEIGRLSKLERLSWYSTKISSQENASQIGELRNLRQLRELVIELENQNQLEEFLLNVLSELQYLRGLRIETSFDDGSGVSVDELNHPIPRPLQCLEELRLWGLPREITPTWLSPTSFPNLRFLMIACGEYLTHMSPEFWNGDWKIEVLYLLRLSDLDEEWERFHGALPYLRMVKVYRCPKLKSFPLDVTSEDEVIWRKEEDRSTGGH